MCEVKYRWKRDAGVGLEQRTTPASRNGIQVYTGALKVVGDTANEEIEETAEVTYELMCRKHWHAGVKRRQGEQLELLDQQESKQR